MTSVNWRSCWFNLISRVVGKRGRINNAITAFHAGTFCYASCNLKPGMTKDKDGGKGERGTGCLRSGWPDYFNTLRRRPFILAVQVKRSLKSPTQWFFCCGRVFLFYFKIEKELLVFWRIIQKENVIIRPLFFYSCVYSLARFLKRSYKYRCVQCLEVWKTNLQVLVCPGYVCSF